MTQTMQKDNLVLVMGESTTGKSMSLRNIPEGRNVLYLNFESGKKLPFPNKANFKEVVVMDPMQVFTLLDKIIADPDLQDKYTDIVFDSANYMMDMFESLHVLTSNDTRSAWGHYAKFWRTLMQQYVPRVKANVIMLAHTLTTYDGEGRPHTAVPIKGALKNQGIESWFSICIATKRVSLKELESYTDGNSLLNITPKEERLGFKYVFQTDLTRETVHERIRGPLDMWSEAETFIDNDITLVSDRLTSFYGE